MLCQGSISLALLNWVPVDKYWFKKKKTYDASWSLTSVHGRTSVCVTRLGRLVITWSTSVWLDFVVLVALVTTCFRFSDSRAFQCTAWHQMFVVWSYRCLHRLPKSVSLAMKQQVHWEDGQVSVTCRRYAFDFQPDIKYCQKEFCCSCFGREMLNPPVFQFRIPTPLNSEQNWTATKRKAC